jgi:hypothetical protein
MFLLTLVQVAAHPALVMHLALTELTVVQGSLAVTQAACELVLSSWESPAHVAPWT